MPSAHPYAAVLITAPDVKVADQIASALLTQKLAACVNQIPGVRSRYWWKEKIEEAQEILLVVKTRSSLIPRIAQCVRENHTYAVPEVIALPIEDGYAPYLAWIGASTSQGTPQSSFAEKELPAPPSPAQ